MTLREILEQLLQMPKPRNEATTRSRMIEPVLEALGWSKMQGEIELEYDVSGPGRNATGRVDVALFADPTRPVVFVEVKNASVKLSGDHADQVIDYAFKKSVPFSVVTNGTTWWLYLSEGGGDTRFAELRLTKSALDQVENDLKAFLGRYEATDGNAEEQARRRLQARREAARLHEELPRVWNQMIGVLSEEPDPDLVDLVSKRVYEQTGGLSPTRKQIAAVLKGRLMPPTETAPKTPPHAEGGNAGSRQAPPAGRPGRETATERGAGKSLRAQPVISARPAGFELWGQLHPVRRYYDILVGVAQALHKQHPHDFHRIGERRGARRLWASQSPGDLGSPKQVGTSGWYINTNMDGASTLRRARQFLEHFNHSPDELTLLYSAPGEAVPPQDHRQPSAPSHGSDLRRGGEESARHRPTSSAPASGRPGRRGYLPASAKPTGFELWGQHHPVRSFNDIPVGVAQAIHDRLMRDGQLHEFHRIGELRGTRHPYASQKPGDLQQAKPVGATGWYIDVHLSSRNTVRRAELFLKHFGYDPDELKLRHDPGSDDQRLPGVDDGSKEAAPRQAETPRASTLRATSPQYDATRRAAASRRRSPTNKPTGFELFGQHHPVRSFNDILIGVTQAIRDRLIDEGRPHDLHRIMDVRGRTRRYASRDPDELFSAQPVGKTGWFVEANLSGSDSIKHARQFLAIVGYDPAELMLRHD